MDKTVLCNAICISTGTFHSWLKGGTFHIYLLMEIMQKPHWVSSPSKSFVHLRQVIPGLQPKLSWRQVPVTLALSQISPWRYVLITHASRQIFSWGDNSDILILGVKLMCYRNFHLCRSVFVYVCVHFCAYACVSACVFVLVCVCACLC